MLLDGWGEERVVPNSCDAVFLLLVFFFFFPRAPQSERVIHSCPAASLVLSSSPRCWQEILTCGLLHSDVLGEKDAKPRRRNVCFWEYPSELRSTSNYRSLLLSPLHFISLPPSFSLASVMPPNCAPECFLNGLLGYGCSAVWLLLRQPLCFFKSAALIGELDALTLM